MQCRNKGGSTRSFVVLSCLLPSLAAASRLNAQNYTATVLYPLTYPNTYIAGDVGNEQTAAGEFVGTELIAGSSEEPNAVLWTNQGVLVNLNPVGTTSNAYGTNGVQQVGVTFGSASQTAAMMWSGTAASAVDLNPAGYTSSTAYGISMTGETQVGNADGDAMLWHGSASSATDLNPAGFYASTAYGTDDAQQVGAGRVRAETGGPEHALLWSGTAASAVDLNPRGGSDSEAFGAAGGQQAGFGVIGGYWHAMLWYGTAASALDLNPAGFEYSRAFATDGTVQVGFGTLFTAHEVPHALLWSGNAASAVDLQSLLPAGTDWDSSEAFSVDAQGNVFGYASAVDQNMVEDFAVEWSPSSVPEPGMPLAALSAALGLLIRRRSGVRTGS